MKPLRHSSVQAGYKQTEVGVIPEEWEVKPFRELFHFSGGYSASRDQLSVEGHCYLHYGDIHGAIKTTVDVRADYPNIPKLDIPLKRVASKSLLEDGDVVFVDASEDDEGTSRHVVVVNKEKKSFISGLHTIVAKSKTDELVHEYRRYCFQTASIRGQFLFYAVGTKVTGISKTNISKLFLPLPPLPEQRAIATALSDVDGLLGGLDRLIAKKRDLKQAAMQQLLTGQTRLPGFHGEWEVKRLEQSCELITKGTTPTSLGRNFTESGVNFLKAESLSENGETIPDKVAFIDAATHKLLKRSQLKAGDLLISIAGVLGRVGHVSHGILPANTNQALAIVRLGNASELDRNFLFYCLRSPMTAKQISDVNVQAAQANISLQNVRDLKIHVPPTLPEQTAIASVLTEMDGELAVLEQRREKTRALKQAMMQELLTGRVRLV